MTGRHDRVTTPPLRGLDQPVIPVAPPVDDVDGLSLGVTEDEEVVADELELEHGFLGRHRRDGELVRLDDRRRALLALARRRLGRNAAVAGVPARGDAPLLAVALDLALELAPQLVGRRLPGG